MDSTVPLPTHSSPTNPLWVFIRQGVCQRIVDLVKKVFIYLHTSVKSWFTSPPAPASQQISLTKANLKDRGQTLLTHCKQTVRIYNDYPLSKFTISLVCFEKVLDCFVHKHLDNCLKDHPSIIAKSLLNAYENHLNKLIVCIDQEYTQWVIYRSLPIHQAALEVLNQELTQLSKDHIKYEISGSNPSLTLTQNLTVLDRLIEKANEHLQDSDPKKEFYNKYLQAVMFVRMRKKNYPKVV